ncbi:MAG: prolyl oligopeptidase family serine peptidase [Saprospiraceae bacterium]
MRFLKFVWVFILGMILSPIFSQEIVSVTKKGSRTKSQLTNSTGIPFIRNGVTYYKMLYTSVDPKGSKDTLSGLLIVPDELTKRYPKLIYEHGTSDCKQCIPSNYGTTGGDEGEIGLIGGGLGYVTILPDYMGMGEGRGFHPYVHAATIVRATMDMLTATDTWCQNNNVAINDQLFITGYSQGGYASMAVQKHIEENNLPQSVTASSHMSGPYSLSGVMKGLILDDKTYFYPAYIPNTLLGMQEVYGNLYSTLSDVFKPAFIQDITDYYNGKITLTMLNTRIIATLITQDGKSVPKNMLQEKLLDEMINDPNHPMNIALKENDVYRWAPKTPTRILYCKADDQVPYENSIVAYDTMKMLGASKLELFDVLTSGNHGTCFNPAILNTILFFASFQSITTDVNDEAYSNKFSVYFNGGNLELHSNNPLKSVDIYNIDGSILYSKSLNNVTHSTIIGDAFHCDLCAIVTTDTYGHRLTKIVTKTQ